MFGLKLISKVQTQNNIGVRIKMTVTWQIDLLNCIKLKNVLRNSLKS